MPTYHLYHISCNHIYARFHTGVSFTVGRARGGRVNPAAHEIASCGDVELHIIIARFLHVQYLTPKMLKSS